MEAKIWAHKETKKAKKDSKKPMTAPAAWSTPVVEVIRRGKKDRIRRINGLNSKSEYLNTNN